MKKNSLKNEKGITLITLVVTIIVLLILAGISITGITGNNGITQKSADARNSAEIKSEMNLVEVASNSARAKNRYGNINVVNLQKELDLSAGNNKTTVEEEKDENDKIGYKITFLDSKRYYFVYNEGEDAEIIFIGIIGKSTNSGIIHAKPRRGKVTVNTSEKVKILLRVFSNIDNDNIILSYGWSESSYKDPDKYNIVAVEGDGNDKTAEVEYPDEIGEYYLYVKAIINNEEEISKVFGEYEIIEEGATIVASRYRVDYLRGDNVSDIGSRGEDTTGEVTLPSITAERGFSSAGWFKGNEYVGDPGDKINVNENLTLTAMAHDSTAPIVTIAREQYNKFSWEAKDKGTIKGYQITTSETPDSNWITDGTLTSGTHEISNASTYYVYAIDNDNNIGKASIDAYSVTKIQGTGTTLTAKIDKNDGIDLPDQINVLKGTPIYVSATANEGYSTVILKSGNERLNENGDTITINSTTTIQSSATKEDKDAPTVIIAKVDYNSFNWQATDDGEIKGYQILLNPTETPSANGNGWTTTGTLTEGTYDVSSAGTYYVYVKDAEGNIGSKSIPAYTVMKNQGANTTLTVRADSTSESTGTALGSNTAVLKDTEIWAKSVADTGYTGTLKIDGIVQNTTEATITVDASKTIESSATENTYTIVFNSNGGSGEMQNMTGIKYTQSVQLTENDFVKEGHTFTGWNTKQNGSGTNYEDTATVNKLTSTNGGTVTLYAQWTANTYTIVFDKNATDENEVTGTMNDLAMTYGVPKNLTQNAYSREGYLFKGWNTEADGSGTSYTDKQSVNNLTDENNSRVTLFAQWEAKRAVFKTGPEVNTKMQRLSGNISSITEVRRATTIPSQYMTDNNVVSTSEDDSNMPSNTPIYMWYENGIIYYYTDDEKPETNIDSSSMFTMLYSVTNIELDSFDTSNTNTMRYMFENCINLTSLNLSNFNTSNVTEMNFIFAGCQSITNLDLSAFDTSNVINMRAMFFNCNSLTDVNLSGFDTSKVKDMFAMFNGCTKLTNLDISGFNTSNVIDMHSMFSRCERLTSLDVSGFDTSSVESMADMFGSCILLTSLDVSGFDTSKVTDMSGMFSSCQALTSIDISGFDTSKVTDMRYMFSSCQALTSIDISGFDTSKVTNMSYMFSSCQTLTSLDISEFNTSKVTDMSKMFYNCTNIKTIYASDSWTTNAVTNSTSMFTNDTKLVGGFGTTYNSSKVDKEYARIDQGTTLPGYFTDVTLYFVEFDANGGTGTMPRQEMHYGTSSNLTANSFTKTGHSFSGWNTEPDGSGTSYTNNQSVLNLEDGYLKTKTLYAQWTEANYKLKRVIGASNILTNGGFENYTLIDAQTKTANGVTHTWDKALNGVPGNTSKSYNITNWGTGFNSGVAVPEIGYHAHMRIVNNNSVVRFKTNEAYAGQTASNVSGGVSVTPGTINANRWLGLSQQFTGTNLTAGATYVVTLDAYRVSGTQKITGGIYHATTNSNSERGFNSGMYSFNPTKTGEWETFSWTFTLSSNYVNTINPYFFVYGYTGGTGEVYVDNVRLEKVTDTSYITKAYDSPYTTEDLNSVSRSGYSFNGWYSDARYTKRIDETDLFNTNTAVFEDVNTPDTSAYIYAKWEDSSKPVVTITRTSYKTFKWSATDNGTITGYQITNSATEPSANGTGWTTSGTLNSGTKTTDTTAAKTYYVYVKDNEGNVGKASIKTFVVTRSQGANTTLNTRVDSTSSSTGTAISSNTAVLNGTGIWASATASTGYTPTLKIGGTAKTASGATATISAATTVASTATLNTYTIEFNKNNSNASGTMTNMSMTYGTAKNLTANKFAVSTSGITSKQIFNGWNTKSDGTGTSYADKESVKNLTTVNGAKVTLYAQWINANYEISSPVTYRITLVDSVTAVNAGGTIKVLKNVSETTSTIIRKNVTISLNGKTITSSRRIVSSTGTTTVKGSGTIYYTGSTNGALTSDGGNIAINSGAVIKSDMTVIGFDDTNNNAGTLTINGSYIHNTGQHTGINLQSCGGATITSSYVYKPIANTPTILTKKLTTLTINGSSRIGGGGTSGEQAIIFMYNTGNLNIGGTSWIMGHRCNTIHLAGKKTVKLTDSSRVYSLKYACIYCEAANCSITFNSAGYFYASGKYVVDAGTRAASVTPTKGHFVSRTNKYMVLQNGTDSVAGGTTTSTRTLEYMNAYNSTAETTRDNCYYLKKGL